MDISAWRIGRWDRLDGGTLYDGLVLKVSADLAAQLERIARVAEGTGGLEVPAAPPVPSAANAGVRQLLRTQPQRAAGPRWLRRRFRGVGWRAETARDDLAEEWNDVLDGAGNPPRQAPAEGL